MKYNQLGDYTDDFQYQLDLYRASNLGGVYTVRMDEQFTLLYGNDLYFTMQGYTPEQLLGKSCSIFIVPEDLPKVQATLDYATKNNQKSAEWEMRIKTSSGELKYTLVSGSFNYRGGQRVFDGYITDITKQKQMEQQIRELTESEAELQKQIELYRMTDAGGVFSVALDEYFTLLYGNDKYYKLHEYTKESMQERLHNHCCEYVHPDDLPIVRESVKTVLREGSSKAEWLMRVITGEGNIRHILCTGMLENVDGQTVMNGMVIDMTKQKEMEEALRQSQEKFKIATENSDVTFWTYDFAKRQVNQTRASKQAYGSETIAPDLPESLVQSGYVRSDSAEAFLELYKKLEAGAKTASGEFWFQDETGEGWWCEQIDYTTVFDSNGTPICAHAVGKDVTSRKMAESRYNEEIAYKNATISTDMIASMRADITTGKVEEVDSAYVQIKESYAGKDYQQCISLLTSMLINDEQRAHLAAAAQASELIKNFKDGEHEKKLRLQRKMPDGTYR